MTRRIETDQSTTNHPSQIMKKLLTMIVCALVAATAWAQTTVTGTVYEP